ncbi:ABC transporter ATP-binding protein [Yanghanlia caeni]|uniref:ABC transporter ATP-binding protein n=1 Tax=Yanghanlia caeni TaxID=3064283 RepID=A0ABU1DA58_9BURK|nr:ABC transporter ATP-binding protein [Alcaligenaceae bacterium LG-2]
MSNLKILEDHPRNLPKAGGVDMLAENVSTETKIHVDKVSQRFGQTEVLRDVNLQIKEGEFIALVGMSGCGKTTLLNLIAGLANPSRGQIQIAGATVNGPRKSTGYMFARDALLPWRTANDNITYGLQLRGVPKRIRDEKARYWLRQLGLEAAGDRFRAQLSQGMRQRVALGRTMALEPDVLLLDEPFAALDAQTKQDIMPQFAQLWAESGTTIVLVTHDIDEAIALADRVVVMGRLPGRIVMDVPVPFKRPRDVNSLLDEADYREIRHTVRKGLMS